MLLYGILLVPMVLATLDESRVNELTVNQFILKIQNNVLKNIETTDEPSFELNLSGLGIHGIDANVFENVSHVKNLSLANNKISILPQSAFASLKHLEHLSVADNMIDSILPSTFSGLDNLTSLNISNNPIHYLQKGIFGGLGNFTDIITIGNAFDAMNTRVFQQLEEDLVHRNFPRVKIDDELNPDRSLQLKVCIREGVLEKLEVFTNTSELESHCKEIHTDHYGSRVTLRQLGISKFSVGWYHLQNYGISSLILAENNIIEVSSGMLNDLPKDLQHVDLSGNKIETLTKGTIINDFITILDLADNAISHIEESVFENTKLQNLILSKNRLRNTTFTATLPPTLTTLKLDGNHIDELSSDFSSGLGSLDVLTLNRNNITELKGESLRGLTALTQLYLSGNNIGKIEKGSFQKLQFLGTIDLSRNNLTSFDKGMFDGPRGFDTIDLSSNKLTRITRESLEGIAHLNTLRLSFNQIETLEAGTFKNLPTQFLFLDNNKIKNIEDGAFDIENLYELNLGGNVLNQLNGESFNGIKSLFKLDLSDNGITEIRRTHLKCLSSYGSLNISKNPIKRLENGALPGLSNDERTILLTDVPIELIQGDVFDDSFNVGRSKDVFSIRDPETGMLITEK